MANESLENTAIPGGARHCVHERVLNYGVSTPLTGTLTFVPSCLRASAPCIVILNAGIVRKSGPNNLNTYLARQFARQGFGVFRFDFAGVGDSPNRQDTLPLRQGVLQDVKESLDLLEKVIEARSFVLVGLCSGADNGLRAAREEADRVIGLAMLDPTIFRTRKWHLVKLVNRLVSAEFWKSLLTFRHPRIRAALGPLARKGGDDESGGPTVDVPELYKVGLKKREEIEECLEAVRAREIALCFAFTGSWAESYNHQDQLYDVYPTLGLKGAAELLYFPEANHTFCSVAHRRNLSEGLLRWLGELKSAATEADAGLGPEYGVIPEVKPVHDLRCA